MLLLLMPEDFEQAMRAAAHRADRACNNAMREYAKNNVVDEDDLTGVLAGELNTMLRGSIHGFTWNAKIMRHRKGVAAEEKVTGADLLIQISISAGKRSYRKGVLVQSKRAEPNLTMESAEFSRLQNQCKKMLQITPSSFVFDYAKKGVRIGSAARLAGTHSPPDLHRECSMTSFRFFYDLFMCPIGDPRIIDNSVTSLLGIEDIPNVIKLEAEQNGVRYD